MVASARPVTSGWTAIAVQVARLAATSRSVSDTLVAGVVMAPMLTVWSA
jgi:hypothetical protein